VRALRGVCIGVGQNLAAGESAEIDVRTAQFLAGIGAVEVVPDVEAVPDDQPKPAKAGKKD